MKKWEVQHKIALLYSILSLITLCLAYPSLLRFDWFAIITVLLIAFGHIIMFYLLDKDETEVKK